MTPVQEYARYKGLLAILADEVNVKMVCIGTEPEQGRRVCYERATDKFILLDKQHD